MKRKVFLSTAILFLATFLLLTTSTDAQISDKTAASEIIATGGAFTLEKAVTAGGGNKMTAPTPLDQSGTTGQAIAGVKSTGGQFSLYSGFWTPETLAPTAASAVVGGRVLTAYGAGIRNVQVSITFPSGEIRTTLSSSFGYYRFAEIPVGAAYVVSVAAKKYAFSQNAQIRQVQDDVQDVDFVADPMQ